MPIRDDSNKIQQTKEQLTFPLLKVDLVYYFAIHKGMNPRRRPYV
jgi:hypothetical protein